MRYRSRETLCYPTGTVFDGGIVYSDKTHPYGDGPWVVDPAISQPKYTLLKPIYSFKECCKDELHPGPPYRSGGPFNLYRFTESSALDCGYSSTIIPPGFYKYALKHYITKRAKDYLDYDDPNAARSAEWGVDPFSYGATGWNRYKPAKPSAGLGTFVGELRELPAMLKQTAKGFHNMWKAGKGRPKELVNSKHLSGQWLNANFGWLPFVSDLRSFYETTGKFSKRVEQLRRDNNRWVRRSGEVYSGQESETLEGNAIWITPTPPTRGFRNYLDKTVPTGSYVVTTSKSVTVWFSAAFKYYIPRLGGNNWGSDVREFAQIYGALPTPSLVWNLTPWSWLADWCSNAGDVIDNLSSMITDNMAAKYAYVMATTKQVADVHASVYLISGTVTGHNHAELIHKSRVGASPFGFGLTGDAFTARQWSILGALGLNKAQYL